jgi:hypothetical protein
VVDISSERRGGPLLASCVLTEHAPLRSVRPIAHPELARDVCASVRSSPNSRGWPRQVSRALLVRSWQSGVTTFSSMSAPFLGLNNGMEDIRNGGRSVQERDNA